MRCNENFQARSRLIVYHCQVLLRGRLQYSYFNFGILSLIYFEARYKLSATKNIETFSFNEIFLGQKDMYNNT